ncbi:hypothetical protein Zmor_004374, partial [Zophobas morio]
MSASIGKLILIIFLLLNFFVGTRIISSQAFCPINLRVTERNLDNLGTIMNVRRVTFSEEGVSWTGKPLDYYIHVIDRSKLEYFFLNRTSARTSVLLKENGSSPRSLSTNRKRRKGDSKREDASSVENNLSDATRVSENHVKPQHSLAADSDSLLSLNESPSTALLLSSSSSCDEQINTPLECHITNPNDSLRIGVAGSSTSSSFSISATSPFSLLESPVLQA